MKRLVTTLFAGFAFALLPLQPHELLTQPVLPAVIVTGGSIEQRSAVREVLASCEVPTAWVTARIGRVDISIVDDIPDAHFRVAATSGHNIILLRAAYDNERPERRVRYDWGEASPIFRDILCHEWAHQVWDALDEAQRQAWNRSHFQLEGWPHPCEAWAENFRLTMYPKRILWRETTVSPYPMMNVESMRATVLSMKPAAHPQRSRLLTLW